MAYRVLSSAATAAVLAAGMSLALVSGAVAQAPAAKKAAPAAPAAATAAAPAAAAPTGAQSAWVKLCEKAQVPKKGADGKEVVEEKNICLVHHEKIDGNTGMVIVSAALRNVEGTDKQHLMVMVPLGMAIPPGIRAAVYTKDMWAKAQKNEKIDFATLPVARLSLKPLLISLPR
jgi:invasion protein IalB